MALDPTDHQAVREAARDILSQDEFSGRDRPWWKDFLYYAAHPDQVLANLIDWVTNQFAGSGASAYMAWAFVTIMTVLIIVGIVKLTRSTTPDNATPVVFAPDARLRSAAEYLRDAERCERDGQWRDAVRWRYAALLAGLAERRVLRLRAGRTTGEYIGDISASLPMASEPFVSASRVFERVWYGDAPASPEDVDAFRQWSDVALQTAAA